MKTIVMALLLFACSSSTKDISKADQALLDSLSLEMVKEYPKCQFKGQVLPVTPKGDIKAQTTSTVTKEGGQVEMVIVWYKDTPDIEGRTWFFDGDATTKEAMDLLFDVCQD